jgi:hypothetical protein
MTLAVQTVQGAISGWEIVAEGISYRRYQLSGPNRIFVARMERANPWVTIESTIAQGRLAQGKETVSGMVARYHQAVSSWQGRWGTRTRAVVGINGSFHNIETGVPYSGQVQSGWYVKRFDDLGGGSGFAWTREREAFIGQCVDHRGEEQAVTFLMRGTTMDIDGVNRAREEDELILFTPQFDATTGTDEGGVEVLVELAQPAGIIPYPHAVRGHVRAIRDGEGSTPIPYDHVVLSAAGAAGLRLLENVGPGEEIGISQGLVHYAEDCKARLPLDWTGTYASVSGSFDFLEDGEIRTFDHDLGATARHPRTAICFNDEFIYFLVVDGRSEVSIGMTIAELAAFCLDELAARWGINQDGGGSSAMWIDGRVVNRPSDGHERPVANGLIMAVVDPAERSLAFAAGDRVVAEEAAELRLGPGTNYAALTTVPAGEVGTVRLPFNALTGVLAKGSYWWPVIFPSGEGWVAEEALQPVERIGPSPEAES